jgi:hypothetical protein
MCRQLLRSRSATPAGACPFRTRQISPCTRWWSSIYARGFATVNALRMKSEVLQELRRHKSYQITQEFYIHPTSQMQDAVSQMPVPDAPKKEVKKDQPENEEIRDVPEKKRTDIP